MTKLTASDHLPPTFATFLAAGGDTDRKLILPKSAFDVGRPSAEHAPSSTDREYESDTLAEMRKMLAKQLEDATDRRRKNS